MKEYMRVTLLNTMYKVYAAVLEDRLSRKIEEKANVVGQSSGISKGNECYGQCVYTKLCG